MRVEDTIEQLNRLIETSKNGELGYAEAAHLVEDRELQTILEGYAKERSGFVKALQAEVAKLGAEPAHSGTIGAAIHRGWMDLKAAATLGDSGAILAACETERTPRGPTTKRSPTPIFPEPAARWWTSNGERLRKPSPIFKHLRGEFADR